MDVLGKDIEAFLAQLVQHAGDSRIVQDAVANVNSRRTAPTIDALVAEIVRLRRDARKPAAA